MSDLLRISLGCHENENGAHGIWLTQETFNFLLLISFFTHSEHFGYIFHLKMLNEIFMAHYSEYFNYYKYGSVSLWKLSYFFLNWFDFETRDATKFVPQNFFIDISRAFLEDILETFSMTLLRICLIFSCDLF